MTEFVKNKVNLTGCIVLPAHDPEIVVGAYYQEPGGEIYHGVQVKVSRGADDTLHRLVSIEDGNRWNDKGVVPPEFIRIPSGETITIEVGSDDG